MPRITCANGHEMTVPDTLAGQTAFCLFCGVLVAVPETERPESPLPLPSVDPAEEPAPLHFGFEEITRSYVPPDPGAESRSTTPEPVLPPAPAAPPPEPEPPPMTVLPATGFVDPLTGNSTPTADTDPVVAEAITRQPGEPLTVLPATILPVQPAPPLPPAPVPPAAVFRIADEPGRPSAATAPPRKRSSIWEDKDQDSEEPLKGYETVNLGLGFHYAKTALQLLALLLLLLTGGMVLYLALAPPDLVMAAVLIVGAGMIFLTLGLFLLAPMLGFIGSILCLSVPRSEAKWFIIGSFLLELLPLLFGVAVQVVQVIALPEIKLPRGAGNLQVPWPLILAQLFSWPCLLLSWVLFMLFLWQLGREVRDRTLASESLAILGKGLVLAVGLGFGLFSSIGMTFLWNAKPQAPARFLAVVCGLVLAAVILYVPRTAFQLLWRTLDLLGTTRHQISRRSE